MKIICDRLMISCILRSAERVRIPRVYLPHQRNHLFMCYPLDTANEKYQPRRTNIANVNNMQANDLSL